MRTGSTLEIDSPKGHHVIHVPGDAPHRHLTDLLRRAGLPLNTRCGERQLCDGCMVELLGGALTHVSTGQIIAASDAPILLRGCEYRIDANQSAKLRITARSLLAYEPLVVTDFSVNVPYAHDPLYQHLSLPSTPSNGESSVEKPVGVAIDIGTTTVVLLLVDLSDGHILAKAASFNQQMHFGDDVVTRITLCFNKPQMVQQLQEAITHRTIEPLLTQALAEAGIARQQLVSFTIAGNTTMLHLLAGVDPSPMGVSPFTPVFLEHRLMSPQNVFIAPNDRPHSQLPCPPTAAIHLLPSAAAYIGSDLTAGIIASGLLYDPGPSLLVDVGTNGEIILKHGDRLLGCATAAGPAFEGAGLSSGIRAGDGAISQIAFQANPFAVHTDMIGAEKRMHPAGICGSAYIDFLAQARRIGLLMPTGRFDRTAGLDTADRLIPWNQNDLAFRLTHTEHARHIVISQTDIACLLQAKAAIAAGILTLLNQAGLQPSQIRKLYLAGGFGMHIDVTNAIACGLLPGFSPSQIQSVGNTALAGAYIALMDSSILAELSRIGRRLQVVELNLDPDFETTYIDQLLLPDVA